MSETRLPAPHTQLAKATRSHAIVVSRARYDRDGRECRPMDLAIRGSDGCPGDPGICPPPCRHEGELAIDRFRTTMAVRDVGLYLRCSLCGQKGPETVPVVARRDRA